MLAMDNLPSHIQGECTFDPKPDGKPYTDAEVTLTVHGERYRFSVEIKHIHRKESFTALLDAARPDTLLVCNRLTTHLADFCSSNAINFIDEAGNARVSCNGLNLWIEGKNSSVSHPATQQQAKPGLGFMKLLFALLAGVLGIFRPKTTKCSGGHAVRGLQRGITFLALHIASHNKSIT